MRLASPSDRARGKRRQPRVSTWPRFRRLAFESLEARRLLAVLTVNSLADNTISGDGLVTLREAVDAANRDGISDLEQNAGGADEIRFAPSLGGGTILLSRGELEITQSLTIDATSLPGGLTINAQKQSRIFDITAATGDFAIAGLTMAGGRATDGELVAAQIEEFPGNLTGGGAIRSLTGGTLSIADSTISGSHTVGATAGGGAIYARGDIVLTDTNITGNHTEGDQAQGGGIHALGDVLLTRSTVSGNFTSGSEARGGGVYATGNITLNHSHVRVNHTVGTFAAGGGIAAGSEEQAFVAVTLFNSTVSGNFTVGSAANGAGLAAFGPVAVAHSDVIYNITFHPAPTGGGIWSQNDPIDIANSIVALNAAAGGSPDVRPGGTLNVAFSLIGNNSGTPLVAAPVGAPDAFGNLIGTPAAPIDPLLGPHANNGGPTLTHALLPGSPAIDAGDPNAASVAGVPPFDQRGANFARIFGSRIDMGAFEFQELRRDDDEPGLPFPLAIAVNERKRFIETPFLLPANTTVPPLLFAAGRLVFPESDGGSGGGLPVPEEVFLPPDDRAADRALRDLLSSPQVATREEVIDAVYALADNERVSLVGFDMGDEPLPPRKKQAEERASGEKPSPVLVNKPPTDMLPPTDSSWRPLAIWSALAGGGTLWVGGAWWWLGRTRRRAAHEFVP